MTDTALALKALAERVTFLEAQPKVAPAHNCDCNSAIQLLEEALCELIQQHEDLVEYVKLHYDTQAESETSGKSNIPQRQSAPIPSFTEGRVSDVVERVAEKVKRMERERRLFAREMELLRQENRELMARWNNEDYRTGFELHYIGASQQDLAFEVQEMRGERTGLQDLADANKEDIETLNNKLARRFKDIESTISYLVRYGWANPQMQGWSSGVDRDFWVPPTSEEPTKTPYPYRLSIGSQPKGWAETRAEICRQLEESQEAYYGVRTTDDTLKSEDEMTDRHREASNAVSRHPSSSLIATNQPEAKDENISNNTNVIKQEDESAFRSILEGGVNDRDSPLVAHHVHQSSSTHEDIDPGLIERAATMMSSKRSKSPSKKQKSKSIGVRARPKQVPINQLFKPQKQRFRDEGKADE